MKATNIASTCNETEVALIAHHNVAHIILMSMLTFGRLAARLASCL